MSSQTELSLDLTSDPAVLPEVRDAIRAWARRLGWTDEHISDIVLAVDEALTNVIRHGYDSQPGNDIELRARTARDRRRGQFIEVRIRDFGKQVPLDKICGRDLNDVRPGGLGVHIIRSIMCVAEYSHAHGGGMCLVMRKYKRPATNNPSPRANQP